MPFDKLDKKIQEAAEQYNTAYNEGSWNKMEALLDKHMPLNKEVKRKFPAGWIFILLFIISGSFIIFFINPWGNKNKPVANSKQSAASVEDNSNNNPATKNILHGIANQKKDYGGKKPDQPTLLLPDIFKREDIKRVSLEKTNSSQVYYVSPAMQSMDKENVKLSYTVNPDDKIIIKDFDYQINNNITTGKKKILPETDLTNTLLTTNVKNNTNPSVKKKQSHETKNKFSNLFSLNFSAGPDVSAVNINNIGTVKLLYGAGVGYSFGKKWQVRSGIYAAKKVYKARPSDYHPPTDFWIYYPHLDDVNADCNVIEVPLILSYKFSQHSKQAWFASAGVSTYFMKKETYNYHSKIAPGQYQVKTYTIENQNKHYLSSLRISAGYEKNLNRIISLSAEPYLNIPLSGVGFGKVKLNGAGLLFSVSVKPFSKK